MTNLFRKQNRKEPEDQEEQITPEKYALLLKDIHLDFALRLKQAEDAYSKEISDIRLDYLTEIHRLEEQKLAQIEAAND